MGKNKLSKVEMKILIFNKMKIKGMTYDEAYKELGQELKYLKEKQIIDKKKKKEEEKIKEENKKNVKQKIIPQ